jgi:hypothetical protein
MSRQVGSRNQRGFVNRLQRVGMTRSRGGAEVLANSSDANSSAFIWSIPKTTEQPIRGIDTGKGMTATEFDNMYDAERENHTDDTSMGVSGIGSLLAHFMFSTDTRGNHQPTGIYTKSSDGEYQASFVPWSDIIETGQYDGNVSIVPMTEEQIDQFKKERPEEEHDDVPQTGVTHWWPYSDDKCEMLSIQFSDKPSVTTLPYEDRWSIIFGQIDMEIQLDKNDGRAMQTLKKYNFMGGETIDYYAGKTEHTIIHFEDNGEDIFAWYNEDDKKHYSIIKRGKGYASKLQQITINPKWTNHGEYLYTLGMRKHASIFNEDDPKHMTAELFLNSYDAQYFKLEGEKDPLKTLFSKMPLVRNNQVITHLTMEGVNVGSARGGADSLMELVYHRAELSYHTLSSQNNRMDKAMGIQQNKNQHDGSLPKNMERLLIEVKSRDLKRINDHFDACRAHAKQKKLAAQGPPKGPRIAPRHIPQPAPEPVAVASVEPIVVVVAEPIPEPSSAPVVEPIAESDVESDMESVAESDVAVVTEPVAEPVVVPDAEPIPEPVAEQPEEQEQPPQTSIKNIAYNRLKYRESAAILSAQAEYLISKSNRDDFDETNGDELLAFVLKITL